MLLRNVVPFNNAQLAPKPGCNDNLTLVTAHSCLKDACIEYSLNRNFYHRLNIVLQVGSVKNRFRHHRTGRNIQRLKHDATITLNAAPQAN